LILLNILKPGQMKTYYLALTLLIALKNLSAQEITIYGQRSTWHADALCNVAFACDYRLHISGGQTNIGYAYHPNGRLWFVTTTNTPDLVQYLRIYDVNIELCQYVLVYDIELPPGWKVIGAANIDHLGRLYVRLQQRDLITNEIIPTISRIANPAIPTFEAVLYTDINHKFWEVHFTPDKIYLIDNDKPYIRVYSADFILLDTLIMDKHIWGLTSYSISCDSIVTYATHMGYSTEVFRMIGPDTMMYISSFDLENNILSPICNYWMGDKVANTNLTSPLEFLSSDPECDLLIDLDRDNSTGVYPYDYLDSTDYCTMLVAPICDPDVYIHTSAPLDSIVLIISNIKEVGDEHLILSGGPTGITFAQRNDSTYVLTSTNPMDSIFQKAILAIRYQHTGVQRTPGERRIILQGFNSIKEGVKITASIQISELVFAGHDITLLICTDTLIQDMSALTGGQPGGYWTPSLIQGGQVFNSTIDVAPSYQYVILDPVCGNDTALVTVHRDAAVPVDLLGLNQILCTGDTLEITVTQPAQSILWDDGSKDVVRELTLPGTYWVALETSGGCTYADSLIIVEGQVWIPTIDILDPVCGLPNGEISIDPIEFGLNESILINGASMSAPTLGSLSTGLYEITAISIDGCITKTQVTLIDQPLLSIAMDTQTTIIHGLWEVVAYLEQNNVAISDILFNPATYIRLTGGAIEVYGDHDLQYEITFVDENGCPDIHLLRVFVEKAQGIYLPNIFSPNSIGGNDVWTPSISESYELEVLRIYDRWGNMVHQSTKDVTWDGSRDGKECQSGAFVYQLILKHVATGDRKVMMGNITLLR